jgi:hypothetical protein
MELPLTQTLSPKGARDKINRKVNIERSALFINEESGKDKNFFSFPLKRN